MLNKGKVVMIVHCKRNIAQNKLYHKYLRNRLDNSKTRILTNKIMNKMGKCSIPNKDDNLKVTIGNMSKVTLGSMIITKTKSRPNIHTCMKIMLKCSFKKSRK